MSARRWLLVFPPLLHSNWGEYYPSTAVLAAVLEGAGVPCAQIDLNAEFLRWLAAPARLAAEERRLAVDAGEAATVHRAAGAIALEQRGRLFDEADRLIAGDLGYGREVALELSRPFHVDEPVSEVLSPAFARSGRARAYRDFYDQSSIGAQLEDPDCAVVGISVPMGPQIAPAILLARWVKARRPDVRVIAGGPAFTLMAPEDRAGFTPAASALDAIVRYEGERAVAAYAEAVGSGAAWPPGGPDGLRAPRVRDLPFPVYDPALMAQIQAPRLSILQARGCYWGKCAYCDFIELYSSERAYDGRTVDGVYDEVRWQRARHGVSKFWLVTEALPPKVARRFAERVIADGVEIDWRSFAMVDPGFTAETLALLKESGCTSLTIGLETMTSRVLQLVRKKADFGMNARFLDDLQRSGLLIDLNLIPDLPTTTYAEALDALDALRPYAASFRTVSVFPFEATRSSDIGRDPAAFGFAPGGEAPDALHPKGQAQFASNRLPLRDAAMSPEERQDVFARYRALARDSAAGGQDTGGQAASPGPVVALPGRQVALYDWARDALWRLPPHGGGVSAGEAAEQVWRSGAAPLDRVPAYAAAVRAAVETGRPKCAT